MNKISWGYVYSDKYTTREEAEQELREHIAADPVGEDSTGIEPLHIRLQVGRVAEHWKRNCVAVGLSQGFIEPLEATALGSDAVHDQSLRHLFRSRRFYGHAPRTTSTT